MKTVLVTGVTGTIGKATAMELAKNGCQVLLLGRNWEKLQAVKSEIVLVTNNSHIETYQADLSEPDSIRKAVEEIRQKHNALNALINIAAIYQKDRKENSQGIEYMFATNHLGPFVLTNAVLNLLKAGAPARIITVSAPSGTHVNFDDINAKQKYSPGFMGIFGATKMMNIMFTYALARRLEGTGVTASVFHPGLVKSDLTKDMPAFLNMLFGMMSGKPDKAAKMLSNMAIGEQFQRSNGTFLNSSGKPVKSSKYSHDEAMQEKLWKASEGY